MNTALSCEDLYDHLVKCGIDFFTGVPDSLLKDICAYVQDQVESGRHVIAANEGGAVALACGYHLATGRIPLVYMQNSGQGNAVNPLTSLVDPEVYGIPMLLLIGWRGEPGVKDEPQHVKQGEVTLPLLDALDVPHAILPSQVEEMHACIVAAIRTASARNCAYAVVVPKGTFAPYNLKSAERSPYVVCREDAVKAIVDCLGPDDVIVSTTGKTSRELFEYRNFLGHDHRRDFLTVGSMGHASQIALGISLAQRDRSVFCIDGDGAAIMHMGSLAIIGSQAPGNFKHVLINNGVHESVGGQPTAGFDIDLPAVAMACGYQVARSTASLDAIPAEMAALQSEVGPALLEIRTRAGARADLGRPTSTPQQNKSAFMSFLNTP